MKDFLSNPLGSLFPLKMYSLDFEEFLWANGFPKDANGKAKECFAKNVPVDDSIYRELFHLLKLYLAVRGMMDIVNEFLKGHGNIRINAIKHIIHQCYKEDIARYSLSYKNVIKTIHDMMSSEMERKNKRFILKNLNEHQRYSR